MFNRFLLPFLFIFLSQVPFAYAGTISGNVRQDELLSDKPVVIDSDTQKPIEGAKIFIPKYNIVTKTDKDGHFELHADFDDKAIMQIEKRGYRPFSLTIDRTFNDKPLRLGIQKTNSTDIYAESEIYHLGDDVYSQNSADCRHFKVRPIGPYYTKNVKIPHVDNDKQAVIVFGSVIGLDTKMAKELGQNKIVSVYSSPTEVIFNGQKIGELHMNGDNQRIAIPTSLIRQNNTLTIRTGKNLFQYNYIDYDDIEIANVRIELTDKVFANKLPSYAAP